MTGRELEDDDSDDDGAGYGVPRGEVLAALLLFAIAALLAWITWLAWHAY